MRSQQNLKGKKRKICKLARKKRRITWLEKCQGVKVSRRKEIQDTRKKPKTPPSLFCPPSVPFWIVSP
jgi:hypothetical protein